MSEWAIEVEQTRGTVTLLSTRIDGEPMNFPGVPIPLWLTVENMGEDWGVESAFTSTVFPLSRADSPVEAAIRYLERNEMLPAR